MSSNIVTVEVRTAPYEYIAAFGYNLRWFANAHPEARFSWSEVDRPNDEEDGELDEGRADWVIFEVEFTRESDAVAYQHWINNPHLRPKEIP